MSRRHSAEKREINPDPKFGNLVVSKFMNSLMYDGKKSAAERIVYGAFDIIEGDVLIEDGRIRSVGGTIVPPPGAMMIDAAESRSSV